MSRLAGAVGAWRSLVAHLLWEQRVGGSNPSAPTNFPRTGPAQGRRARRSACSSTGQSTGLLSRGLQVRVLPGAPSPVWAVVCSGGRSSVGRAPDCDSGGRGFEPHRPPHPTTVPACAGEEDGPLAQLVEQWTLNPLVVGSSPTRPTTHPPDPSRAEASQGSMPHAPCAACSADYQRRSPCCTGCPSIRTRARFVSGLGAGPRQRGAPLFAAGGPPAPAVLVARLSATPAICHLPSFLSRR